VSLRLATHIHKKTKLYARAAYVSASPLIFPEIWSFYCILYSNLGSASLHPSYTLLCDPTQWNRHRPARMQS
jgi:hypothetical protein